VRAADRKEKLAHGPSAAGASNGETFMWLSSARRRRIKRHHGLSRLRVCAAVLLVAWTIGRPVRLVSVRWWRSSDVAASIGLTTAQREAIDRIYEQRLAGRRRCVERLVEASSGLDQLIRDGVHGEEVLKQTQAMAGAAMEGRILTRILSEEIVAVLSPSQRESLRVMLNDRIVE
jgi:hypothetical protein